MARTDNLSEDFKVLLNYTKIIANKVDRVIEEIVQGKPSYLYDAAMHLIKAGGKRVRPLMVVLCGRLYGLPEDVGVLAGASVELLHNFSLIHDDIMDRDEMRRGVPTVHKIWGVDVAILAGDLLFALAYYALAKLRRAGVKAERIAWALEELSIATKELAEGQALDMEFPKRSDVSIDEYITMVKKKTSALFAASAAIGAIIAGANEGEVKKVKSFAENIGIAFQIRDDELGIIADEEKLGKPVYSDIREGKRTLLVVYALENISGSERKKLLAILGNKNATKSELEEAAKIIISSGALEFSDKLAQEYLKRGLDALELTNHRDDEAKRMLRILAHFFARRLY